MPLFRGAASIRRIARIANAKPFRTSSASRNRKSNLTDPRLTDLSRPSGTFELCGRLTKKFWAGVNNTQTAGVLANSSQLSSFNGALTMPTRAPLKPRTGSIFSAFLGFFLSALLGIAFVAVVNKTHNLFSGSGQCARTATWHLAANLARRAIGA
jgi:hypothetical protein